MAFPAEMYLTQRREGAKSMSVRETNSVPGIANLHENVMDKCLGILVNFNEEVIRDGIKRVVN
jgi:hypothetical protein